MDTTPTTTTTHRIAIAIRASRSDVWHAIVDGATTPAYYYGFEADFDLTPGAPYRYTAGGGDVIFGTVVAAERETELVTTFNGRWDPAVAVLPESTVTYTLSDHQMAVPGITVLALVHEGLPDTPVAADIEAGWVSIVSGLKTLLETGTPMIAAAA
jgi:uncharacterized protein YndB with AHSA1/START domain